MINDPGVVRQNENMLTDTGSIALPNPGVPVVCFGSSRYPGTDRETGWNGFQPASAASSVIGPGFFASTLP